MKHIQASDIQEEGVSHNPEITKRVFLRNGEIPALTTFAQATFQPGQSCPMHAHETMYEIWCIQEGKLEFTIGDQTFVAEVGDCVVAEPSEPHCQRNPFDTPTRMIYFGIATE